MQPTTDLIDAIARLSRMLKRRPQGDKREISKMEHRMLSIILREDGIRPTDLAARMEIRPASLTSVLKRLETLGYIRRERGERDNRVVHVHATEKTRQEHALHEARRQEWNRHLLACLTDAEAETFLALCDKMSVYLSEVTV